MSGTLYVVATPIGNLEDITVRALRVLKEVAVVACEDTRHTRALLTHFAIGTPTVSYHEHNEALRTAQLIERLSAGESVALVSDAGTPAISDPGHRLVAGAARHGIRVVPVPGPSAVVTALSASGLATDSFLFVGFLPPKQGARAARLAELASERATLVFYEAPHRIGRTLAEMLEAYGDREAVVARELTKLHEEFLRGPLSEVLASLAPERMRGEFVVLVSGARDAASGATVVDARERVAELEAQGLARMDAIKQTARELGIPKREIYTRVTDGPGPND
ncbi:MAG TPA: 16S rRNA (cytidine(1402)-2'-O)-methyltransferase [Blastocatellia bacterium]|nr:16S rRNA (cytidine(1402)-2'-O)-methyltransferase [Blastocatellia bacterium]